MTTALFPSDEAAFPLHRTTGPADAGWASFQSYDYPTRCIRHSNYVLHGPVSTTTDRQDATFRVGC